MAFSLKFLRRAVGGAAIFAVLGALPAAGQDMPLSQVLIPGEDWKVAAEGFDGSLRSPTTDREGGVLFVESGTWAIHRYGTDGKTAVFRKPLPGMQVLQAGPKGKLFASHFLGVRRLEFADPEAETPVAAGAIRGLVPLRDGGFFVTRKDLKAKLDQEAGIIFHYPADGGKQVEVARIPEPGELAVSPDGGTLVAADGFVTEDIHHHSTTIWAFSIGKEGKLSGKAPYYGPLRLPEGRSRTHIGGLTFDRDGRLYAATNAGIQVFDPTGRPCGVILSPDNPWLEGVTFGGADRNELFAAHGKKLYRRRTKVRGPTWPGE